MTSTSRALNIHTSTNYLLLPLRGTIFNRAGTGSRTVSGSASLKYRVIGNARHSSRLSLDSENLASHSRVILSRTEKSVINIELPFFFPDSNSPGRGLMRLAFDATTSFFPPFPLPPPETVRSTCTPSCYPEYLYVSASRIISRHTRVAGIKSRRMKKRPRCSW